MIGKKEGIYMKNRSAVAFVIILMFIISGWPSSFEDWGYALSE
jgi:hypothetical protein